MGQFSTPIAALIARLDYHTLAGQDPARLLDGFKWESTPVESVQGLSDLPAVRIYCPEASGTYRPTTLQEGAVNVTLNVLTVRTEGIVAHMEALEKVMDALAIDHESNGTRHQVAGQTRHTLAGLIKPLSWSVAAATSIETSLQSIVTLNLTTRPSELGSTRN